MIMLTTGRKKLCTTRLRRARRRMLRQLTWRTVTPARGVDPSIRNLRDGRVWPPAALMDSSRPALSPADSHPRSSCVRRGCDQAINRMGAYLANTLSAAARGAFCRHLRTCEACHNKLLSLQLFMVLRPEAVSHC